eukprot:116894-Prorocentrum_minimum.AAC.1
MAIVWMLRALLWMLRATLWMLTHAGGGVDHAAGGGAGLLPRAAPPAGATRLGAGVPRCRAAGKEAAATTECTLLHTRVLRRSHPLLFHPPTQEFGQILSRLPATNTLKISQTLKLSQTLSNPKAKL